MPKPIVKFSHKSNKKGHANSTANAMGKAWLLRLFRLFLWMDILLLLTAAFVITRNAEIPVIGRWHLFTERDLSWETRSYSFFTPEGEWHEVKFADTLESLRPFAIALAAIQCYLLLRQRKWGEKEAKKILKSLDKMAAAANRIAGNQKQPAAGAPNLHGLEEALGKMAPGELLRTGDSELEGLENAINALLSRMQESYLQQARFVSDASHELRTPITVIQGYANMLKRWGSEDEKVLEESIEAISVESAYMKRLVDQLLFLARGDTGRNRVERQKIDIRDVIQEAHADAALIDNNHEWLLGSCESAYISADANMIKQCVRILVENAARYTPSGGAIRLQTYQDADTACIEVQDTGCGIAAKDIPHIFERFYRADEARSRESGGSGLGLSIAQWIVESHEGHFEVFSREGLGSRFTIRLPLYTEPEPDDAQ